MTSVAEDYCNNGRNTDRRIAPEPVDLPDDVRLFSSELDWLDNLIRGFRLGDIINARGHTEDFKETRAEYINTRLRIMLIFLAIGISLWIGMDFLLVSPEYILQIVCAHLFFLFLLILLIFYTWVRTSPEHVHSVLSLTIFGILVFYGSSMWILSGNGESTAVSAYLELPKLVVVMIGLFPLTLLYGLFIVLMTLSAYLYIEHGLGVLYSYDTFNYLRLFFIFAGLSLWIQSGQLLMLLRLYRESTQDALTGLMNRRVIMRRLAVEVRRAMSASYTFSILILDLDRFKRINDNYGHLTGDQVLKSASKVLSTNLRKNTVLARFGGEEFLVILPGVKGQNAALVAERLCSHLDNTVVTAPNGDKINMPASIGVTEFKPGEKIYETINRADDLLYEAKNKGRNRVVYK